MILKDMYSFILKEKEEGALISGLIDIFYRAGIDDFLLLFSRRNDNYFISSRSADGKLMLKKEEFDWKRMAIKQDDNYYHIDTLIYDLKLNNETVLEKNREYYVYTDDEEKTALFVHYRMNEFPKSLHSDMHEFIFILDAVFSKIYLNKMKDLNQSIDVRIKALTKKISTLQRLAGLLQSTFELNRILDIISRYISESLGFKVVLLSLYNEQENAFVRLSQYGLDKKVFEKLQSQKLPYSTVKELMVEKNRISKSYYINHNESGIQKISDLSYILPDEKPNEYSHWHPEDILLIPLYEKEGNIIGIISVDKPVDRDIKIKEAIDLLESFAQTASLAIENSKLFRRMEDLISDLERVNRISSNLTAFLDIESMLNFLVKEIKDNFNYINVTVWLFNEEGQMEVKAFSGYQKDYLEDYKGAISSGEGLTGWVAENDVPVLVRDTGSDPRYIGRNDISLSEIAVPLKISNHIIGVLNVEKEGINALDENDMRIISIIASHLSTAIDNTFKYEETEKLAVTDGMTGMFNYRYFMNRLREELDRSKLLNIPLSIIMIDIDYFKEINDTYGHMVGDRIIRELADLLRSIVRKGDIVTRYGGDEFFVILPGSSKTFTLKLAKRIMNKVTDFDFAEHINITLSLGTVSYPDDANTMDSLLRWVDDALYSAKKKGRNRVEGGK